MTETDKFELTLSMQATVTVYDATGQPTDWLKPGTECKHVWKGMPTPEEVALRYQDMTKINAGVLEDVIVTVRDRLEAAKHGK
jgi:hypothetical protein